MKKHFFLIILVFLCSCSAEKTLTGKVIREEDISLEVYFCPRDRCMEKIIQSINTSTDIKCAFYDLDLPELIDVLNERDAKVVLEEKNSLPQFRSNYSYGLMHNKFCVLDEKRIITGSMNPTERGNYYNNNNLVFIESETLAQNYLDEFEELWNGEFGKGKKTRNTEVYYENGKIEIYFCPEDNCKLQVINELESAKSSIYFMTFTFTDEDVGNLLWNKNHLGIDVRGILEERQIGKYSRYDDLKKFSRLDKNRYNMHHKVFIIDNETVITGSYNPTESANEKNDENILIIHDKDITEEYMDEFNKLYNLKHDIPEKTDELIIKKVLYDAEGSDKGNEFVEIKNIANSTINIGYYFITNNRSDMRLEGKIPPGKTKTILPKFTMRNSDDFLILKKHEKIIDVVFWGKRLKTEEGEHLIRKNERIVNLDSWAVV